MSLRNIVNGQAALLRLLGLTELDDITRVQIDIQAGMLPVVTLNRIAFASAKDMPDPQDVQQLYVLTPIDPPPAPQPAPAFDIDAACLKALRLIQSHIEDSYTVHKRIVGRDFAATHDAMVSRFRHLSALYHSLAPTARSKRTTTRHT